MSLRDTLATLTVLPDGLSVEARRRALLAINRLTASPASITNEPAAVLRELDRLHALAGTEPKQAGEERRHLETALALPLPPAASSTSSTPGSASFRQRAGWWRR